MSTPTSPLEAVVIPAKCFYSTKPQVKINIGNREFQRISEDSPRSTKRIALSRSAMNSNKRISHKIRRRSNQHTTIEIDSILSNLKNENLRTKIENKRLEKQQIKKIYDSLRSSVNPIELAKPLRSLNNSNPLSNIEDGLITAGFSDDESFSEDVNTEHNNNTENNNKNDIDQHLACSIANDGNLEDICGSGTPSKQRKFFKSKRASIPKLVQVTENIKAVVCNGKMKLVAKKRKFPQKLTNDFSVEINNILKNLDNQCEREKAEVIKSHDQRATNINDAQEKRISNKHTSMENLKTVQPLHEVQNFDEIFLENFDFQTNIPANAEEAMLMEYEETDEGLGTFISSASDAITTSDLLASCVGDVQAESTDEDHEKQDANLITVHDVHASSMPKEIVEFPENGSTQGVALSSPKLYPIFYPGQCQPLKKKSTRRIRAWNGGFGLDQLQIDAGQREFGVKQCKQCGLIYGVHEPEEEKLHHDFHSSLHVLRFKGWIDEDRVADYPQWGPDGRIVRITESTDLKRRKRLEDILQIVDRELGFSSYIIPKAFVAFFAVRKCLIVGFCLVQPLKMANKYVCSNGIDCCTVEEFEAKCGISRIWVSSLHRRMHIARKLLKAVQMNTILGEEIPLHKIAFSSPTEDGKRFAQKATGTENFLVYQ